MIKKALILLGFFLTASNVIAIPIAGTTCGEPDRTGTLTAATQCAYGSGNPDATTVAGYYGDTWTNEGELTSDGTNSYLTATSDAGWGVIPNSGTWAIDASFWTVFDHAVISMHIGNGAGDPDHWAWLIADNDTSGTWSIDYILGGTEKGGGLSNIKLWGVVGDGTTTVPEPGSIALLGLGLLGLVAARRRKV